MKKPRFEVYEARDGWRWRLIAANGRIIATGEAHTRKADAERAVATVMTVVGIVELLANRANVVSSATSWAGGPTFLFKDFDKNMSTKRVM